MCWFTQDASCLWATITVLLWLLETRASELVATASTRTPDVTRAGEEDGNGVGGDGVEEDGGAASTVRLMSDVFGRSVSLFFRTSSLSASEDVERI